MDIAVVTGAAGSIGGAVAARVAARGIAVVGWDRQPLTSESGFAAFAEYVELDVTDEAAVAAAIAHTSTLGTLRYVFAVAGGNHLGELTAVDRAVPALDAMRLSLEMNLVSTMVCVSAAVPVLRAVDGDRSITLTSSINAYGGFGSPGYSAAKAGLHGYAATVAALVGDDGIRINAVAPGTVDTLGGRALLRAQGLDERLTDVADTTPLGRIATPDDIATVMVSLAVDCRAVTGQTVVVDNGQMLRR